MSDFYGELTVSSYKNNADFEEFLNTVEGVLWDDSKGSCMIELSGEHFPSYWKKVPKAIANFKKEQPQADVEGFLRCEDEFIKPDTTVIHFINGKCYEHTMADDCLPDVSDEALEAEVQRRKMLHKMSRVTLDAKHTYALPIKNGHLDVNVSPDPDYPGIDIHYVSRNEDKLPEDQQSSRPRVLVETDDGHLRTLVWGDPSREDYTHRIDFLTADEFVNEKKEETH